MILERGALRGRKAAAPLFATPGGMLGPIGICPGLALLAGPDTFPIYANGWAIPAALDTAFSDLVGRLVFGAIQPAIRFLQPLTIADEATGLPILAIFHPTDDLAPVWLVLPRAAAIGVFLLFHWLPPRMDRHDQLRPKSTWGRRNLSF